MTQTARWDGGYGRTHGPAAAAPLSHFLCRHREHRGLASRSVCSPGETIPARGEDEERREREGRRGRAEWEDKRERSRAGNLCTLTDRQQQRGRRGTTCPVKQEAPTPQPQATPTTIQRVAQFVQDPRHPNNNNHPPSAALCQSNLTFKYDISINPSPRLTKTAILRLSLLFPEKKHKQTM